MICLFVCLAGINLYFSRITSLEMYCALLLELEINATKIYDSAFLSVGRQAEKMLKKRVGRSVKPRHQREMFHLHACHLSRCQAQDWIQE